MTGGDKGQFVSYYILINIEFPPQIEGTDIRVKKI